MCLNYLSIDKFKMIKERKIKYNFEMKYKNKIYKNL